MSKKDDALKLALTEEERHACTQSPFSADNYRAIEAKLKERNT